MKVSGPVFVKGQTVILHVNCYICKDPIVTFHDRAVGVCVNCLKEQNITVSRAVVVNPPTTASRWN